MMHGGNGSAYGGATRYLAADRRRNPLSPLLASIALVVLAPILLLLAAAVLLSSPGPILVKTPFVGSDNRLVYLSEFRIRHCFDYETYERFAGRPRRWLTPVGAFLRATRLNRLPVLLDVRAGRVGLTDALLG